MSVRTTGGGGWGDPRQRDPEHIRQDILNELITPEQAEQDYGYRGG
jgi:N-methylhydantoinase B